MRAKPKIAPRPSIAPKPSPQSSPSRKSSSEAVASTTSTEVASIAGSAVSSSHARAAAPLQTITLREDSLGEGEAKQIPHIRKRFKELIVTTSLKPKTPAKPSFRKGGEDESSKSTQKGLHARLPSADSGIQADGGCDSLSRYRGKSFLSASDKNDFLVAEEGVSSSPGKSKSNTSGASGGYGGGQPQQKLPLVSRVVTLPSKSFFTTSAAATPATSSRTSNGVTPTPAARTPVPVARTSVTSQNVTLTSSHNAPKSSEQKNGLHVSSRNLPAKDALERSDSSESQHNASISNQNSNSPSKSTSNRKSDSNVSTNQNADTFNQSNHTQSTSEQNVINITPNVKVMSNQGVKIAISKNTVNIATAKTPSISGNSEMVRTTGPMLLVVLLLFSNVIGSGVVVSQCYW
uniref:Uncharacterized protein n=1 Tax=Biomphalaria glabrata TaxID=6526 RepID=A0A2C9L1R3_BIOGL